MEHLQISMRSNISISRLHYDQFASCDTYNVQSIIASVESKFVSVLAGPLKSVIGLSDTEICELTDYFRIEDGRIFYTQFCEVIHDSGIGIYIKYIIKRNRNYWRNYYAL